MEIISGAKISKSKTQKTRQNMFFANKERITGNKPVINIPAAIKTRVFEVKTGSLILFPKKELKAVRASIK